MTTEKTPVLKIGNQVTIISGPREGREGEIMDVRTKNTGETETIID